MCVSGLFIKKTKIIFLLLLLIISFLFFIVVNQACNITNNNIEPEDVKNRVIAEATEYLETNYPDDVFTFKSAASPNWSDPYYKVGFYSKKYDDQEVVVCGFPTNERENGKQLYEYGSDYFRYQKYDEANEFFCGITQRYFPETQMYVEASFIDSTKHMAENIESHMSFEEYLTSDYFAMMVTVFSETQYINNLNNIDRFLDYMLLSGININFQFVEVDSLFLQKEYQNQIHENKYVDDGKNIKKVVNYYVDIDNREVIKINERQ